MRSIRVKLVALYLLIIVFSMQLVGAYFVTSLNRTLIHNATMAIQAQAQLLATMAAPAMTGSNTAQNISSVVSSFPKVSSGDVYLLNAQGVVVNTSAGNALVGQKRLDSINTPALVEHKQTYAIRFDGTSNEHIFIVATPMTTKGQFVGVVEYVVPIEDTYNTVRQVTTIFYTGSALVLALTVLLSIILSRAITRPIVAVTKQARNLAGGDFSQRVTVDSQDELGDLGKAVNELTDKLERALDENAQERERLQAVMTSMADGVIAFDQNYQTMLMNEAARRLVSVQSHGRVDVARALGIDFEKIARRSEGSAFVRPLEDRLLHVHVTPIRKRKSVEGFVAIIRDVTEQEKFSKAQRDFVANVSHELRTPLTSMKSYLEAVRDLDENDVDTRTRFLDVIVTQTERMARLTQDLLQLSGLDSKPIAIHETHIDVTSWLVDLIQRFYMQAAAQGVTLELHSNVRRSFYGNRDMLDRALDNLLSNALKYTPSGGQVDVEAAVDAQYLTVEVRDNGIGIPATDLPHVFERFYRVDKARARRSGGTGLGLSLVREIVERHGGTIDIASEPGIGTAVTVTIPLGREEDK